MGGGEREVEGERRQDSGWGKRGAESRNSGEGETEIEEIEGKRGRVEQVEFVVQVGKGGVGLVDYGSE